MLVTGLLMGAADVVPGFSGGTVALVAGIYERLVGSVRAGAAAVVTLLRGRGSEALAKVRAIEWPFLVTLGVGVAVAIATLARGVEGLLETHPVRMSAVFLGLVVGATIVARRQFLRPVPLHGIVVVVVGALTFVALGASPGAITDPSLPVVAASGALAISAMILPGVSGSFLLLVVGMYPLVIGAVADRDLAFLAVFGSGALVGLAAFSTVLDLLLRRAHDNVLAILIGLMLGSSRVLWPWPVGSGVGDPTLGAPGPDWPVTSAVAVAAALAVVAFAGLARRRTGAAEA